MTIPPLNLYPRKGPLPASSAPQPMNIPAVQSEMDSWLHRGGRMSPEQSKIGGGLPMPGGTYGGEFSDEDFAAYLDAAKKLGFAKGMQHLQPLIAAHGQMSQKPDATATRVAPSEADLTAAISRILGQR